MPPQYFFELLDPDSTHDYDYVFCGAGLSSLSLLMRMLQSEEFKDCRYLLVDKDQKKVNDRTWCFWEKGEGFFDSIVHKRWDKVWFHGEGFSKQFNIAPYQYKMIRGIDLYQHCLNILVKKENVRIIFEPINSITNLKGKGVVELHNGVRFGARKWLFNSIPFDPPKAEPGTHYLKQHFKGWFIETAEPFFDPSSNTLMDFRVNQEHGTTFVYTMPLDETHALIEYTLFTENLLQQEQYDEGLRNYISDYLQLSDYSIKEEEFGVIPMTGFTFPERDGNIVYIGTAGGQTKPSSGYTFQFVQQHSAAILKSLLKKGHPFPRKQHGGRFRFYDNVLLDVLVNEDLPGDKIFTRLFKRNSAQRIFRFLDNHSYLPEELLLISSLPTMPFLRAARRVI